MKFSDDLVRMLSNIYDGDLLPKKLYSFLYSCNMCFKRYTLKIENNHSKERFIKQSLRFLLTELAHFMPLVPFNSSWRHGKSRGFLLFSEGIERNQWHEMGQQGNNYPSVGNTRTPIDTRRRFNVYKLSIGRRRRSIDVL